MRGAKHAQLIASQDSLNLVGPADRQAGSRLAVPFGHPFSLGTQRIELFSSGHGLGAASLVVNVDGRKIVYAGMVNPRGSALGGSLDHRSADILIVSALYGGAGIAFPEPNKVRNALQTRCREIAAAGGVAVLLVRDAAKALDLAASLGPDLKGPDLGTAAGDLEIQTHRSFHDAARRARPKLFETLRRWKPTGSGGRVLLWPLLTRSKLPIDALPTGSEVLLVSGQASDPSCVAAAGATEGFVLSNQADHGELVRYIRSSGASSVYLTQSCDRGKALREALPKLQIEPMGPPEQLSLFAA